MTNAIRLLERLGQSACARTQPEMLDRLAAEAGVSPEIAAALAAADQTRLAALLGSDTNVCCMILPAKQDEDEEKREDDDQDDEDESEKGLPRGLRKVAVAS
jgi:hypothetical protein